MRGVSYAGNVTPFEEDEMKNKGKRQIMKRRTYYIKKVYQRRFIIKKIALVVVGALAANLLLYIFLQKWINDAMYRVHINVRSVSDVIMSPLLFTNLIIFSLAVGGSFLMISRGRRRLDRQFHCFVEGLREVNKGDLTIEMKDLSNGDFNELSDGFNHTVSRLREKTILLRNGVAEVETVAKKYDPGNKEMNLALQYNIGRLEEELSVFNLR